MWEKLSTGYSQFVDNLEPVDKVIQSENTNIISDFYVRRNGL